jgi:hypothetical protein
MLAMFMSAQLIGTMFTACVCVMDASEACTETLTCLSLLPPLFLVALLLLWLLLLLLAPWLLLLLLLLLLVCLLVLWLLLLWLIWLLLFWLPLLLLLLPWLLLLLVLLVLLVLLWLLVLLLLLVLLWLLLLPAATPSRIQSTGIEKDRHIHTHTHTHTHTYTPTIVSLPATVSTIIPSTARRNVTIATIVNRLVHGMRNLTRILCVENYVSPVHSRIRSGPRDRNEHRLNVWLRVRPRHHHCRQSSPSIR